LSGKHCTLTPHVKATDFAFSFFVRGHCAPANECVAMQRDAAPKCRKTPAIGLAGMLLDGGWPKWVGRPELRQKIEPEGM
jgi:hypothetical protein